MTSSTSHKADSRINVHYTCQSKQPWLVSTVDRGYPCNLFRLYTGILDFEDMTAFCERDRLG
jgi:hypothetical protein